MSGVCRAVAQGRVRSSMRAFSPPVSRTRQRVHARLRRAMALLRRAGTQQLHGIPTHGPRLCCASSKGRCPASGARGQSDGAWEVTQSLHHWHSSQTHPRILATDLARALLRRLALVGKSNCGEVARRSAGLKAGAGAPPPAAADGLDPVRSPVCWLCMRSAEVRARDRRARQATLYFFGSHVSPRAIMVLRMMISLRMQATIATFGGLPLAISRS